MNQLGLAHCCLGDPVRRLRLVVGLEARLARWRECRPRSQVSEATGAGAWKARPNFRERYPFTERQATTRRESLKAGDYGLLVDGLLQATVEPKSLADLVTSLTTGKLKFELTELAVIPRAAVVVEEGYSRVFKIDHVRPSVVPTGSPNGRSGSRPFRSSSARPASSPRSGPTASSRVPRSGSRRR